MHSAPLIGFKQVSFDIDADALAMWDKGRKDWVGHTVRISDERATSYMVVDMVTNLGDNRYRMHLIPTD